MSSSSTNPLTAHERLAFISLVAQVQAIVEESGTAEGFKAPQWVESWIERPQVKLRGRTPRELLATPEGQDRVALLLRQVQDTHEQA